MPVEEPTLGVDAKAAVDGMSALPRVRFRWTSACGTI